MTVTFGVISHFTKTYVHCLYISTSLAPLPLAEHRHPGTFSDQTVRTHSMSHSQDAPSVLGFSALKLFSAWGILTLCARIVALIGSGMVLTAAE